MEIRRVFRALRYKPKYLATAKRPRESPRIFPVSIGLLIVGMVVGGLWLTKIIERNINNAIIQQYELAIPKAQPAGQVTERSVERPTARESQIAPEIAFDPDYLIRPVEFAEVIRKLGWLKHPRFGYWLYHDGIDLQVLAGAVIRGVAPGTVAEIVRNYDEEGLGVVGTQITLSHGSRGQSVYIFPGEVGVRVGQSVSVGTALGVVGGEASTKSAVHIGVTWEERDLDWLAILENRG